MITGGGGRERWEVICNAWSAWATLDTWFKNKNWAECAETQKSEAHQVFGDLLDAIFLYRFQDFFQNQFFSLP